MGTIINAGKLNKRITFFRYVEERDDLGATVQKKEVIRNCWAKIKSNRAYETSVEAKIKGEVVYTLLVRYFKGLSTSDLIEYKGQELEITQVNNLDEGNYAYEINAIFRDREESKG